MTETTHVVSLVQSLQAGIQGDVLTDEYSLGLYSTDASVYQIRPLVVVLPKNADDVSRALKEAQKHGITVLPRGGGTSLAGQTTGKSLVLDFSKYMNQILEINEKERWVRVQPGLVRDVLNEQLQSVGLHFAPDPATSSRANVGGMVGNNSSGTKSILYGKTVDHVLEAEVALADGTPLKLKRLSPEEYQEKIKLGGREGEIYRHFQEIVQTHREEIAARFPKVMRRVGGYNLDEFIDTDHWNLSKLITGSEGTLATTLELKLNLEPLPVFKSVCVVHFNTVLEAIKAVEPMLKYTPAAIEILDSTVVELSRSNLTTQRSCHFIEGHPAAILIVEFYGDDAEEVLARPKKMVEELRQLNVGYAYPLFPEGKNYDDVWLIRKKGLGLMLGIKGNKKPLPFIEDAGIPTPYLPEYIDRVLKVCEKHETKVAMYAHASVGVIHVRPILDLRLAEDIERFQKIADETFDLVKAYGGSWSGEHGDGLVRSAYNEKFFGPEIYQAFREIKHLFDPENRMNPGKIVDAQPITENLRYGASYQDRPVKTEYQYRHDESFENAVHMCTGVGECRKLLGGTMCPSFKATRDEEHSTRGRANALRLAMSGQLDEEGVSSQRLHQVMDLCLSCKACKSECPSNVDMAKLKSEVTQQYYDQHGSTLRDRMIRSSSDIAAKFSGNWAKGVNTIQKSPVFRSVMEKIAGFDKRRILPEVASQSFSQWFATHATPPPPGAQKVALFADTYLNYHEPQIGIAAYQLLTACGYEVLLAEVGCCQRPKISHGFLREAKKEGLKTVQHLDTYLTQEIPVVVCEPSCTSALTDDLPDLISDDSLASRLKKGVWMIDQFLHHERTEGRLKVALTSSEPEILLHGHCHQKALYGTQAMKQLLEENGERRIDEVDSGCCGMAGSFGYEKEHYELSEKIGGEILFPAVKAMNAHTQLVACGFSCRHQIEHFTGKKARHWVEVVQVKDIKEKAD
ncbi:MAG: FAD-linked oxidase C-terminal domain-containing protein [Cyclobacteriaceae bacterium]